uniref:(California timema) hypothetical protein n=1 Tax=Timema californicum TaxID=61474 RepID=A0A7R9P9I5_TIMCA|nr:unnamed protein product [Timema californicum]
MLVLLPFTELYFSTNHFIALAHASTISQRNQWVTSLVEEREQQSEKIISRTVKCSLEMGCKQLLPLFKAPYLTTALLMLAIEFLAMMRVITTRNKFRVYDFHCRFPPAPDVFDTRSSQVGFGEGGREQSERHCGRALYLSSLGATAQTEEDVRKGEVPALVPKPDRSVAFAVDCTFPLPINKINSNASPYPTQTYDPIRTDQCEHIKNQ